MIIKEMNAAQWEQFGKEVLKDGEQFGFDVDVQPHMIGTGEDTIAEYRNGVAIVTPEFEDLVIAVLEGTQ